MYTTYLPSDLLPRYHKFLLRAYAESSREIAVCPAPGCMQLVRYRDGGAVDVHCGAPLACHAFCFRCKFMPSHRYAAAPSA